MVQDVLSLDATVSPYLRLLIRRRVRPTSVLLFLFLILAFLFLLVAFSLLGAPEFF